MQPDGRHRHYGNWRHSPDAESEKNKVELIEAKKKIKEPNFKTAGCATCEIGATNQNNGMHTTACRQTVHDSGVAPSLWTVKFDSNGRQIRQPGEAEGEPQAKRTKVEVPPEQTQKTASSDTAA